MNLDRYKKLTDYQIRLEPLEPTNVSGNGTRAPDVQVTSTLGTLMYLPAEHSIIGATLQDLPHLIAHIEKLEADLRTKIAAEIRDAPRIYDTRMTQDPASWIEAFDRGIEDAARIAEGKQ